MIKIWMWIILLLEIFWSALAGAITWVIYKPATPAVIALTASLVIVVGLLVMGLCKSASGAEERECLKS
jgi:hypothetical protein